MGRREGVAGSQLKQIWANMREIWSLFLVPVCTVTTEFWINWSLFKELLEEPGKQ